MCSSLSSENAAAERKLNGARDANADHTATLTSLRERTSAANARINVVRTKAASASLLRENSDTRSQQAEALRHALTDTKVRSAAHLEDARSKAPLRSAVEADHADAMQVLAGSKELYDSSSRALAVEQGRMIEATTRMNKTFSDLKFSVTRAAALPGLEDRAGNFALTESQLSKLAGAHTSWPANVSSSGCTLDLASTHAARITALAVDAVLLACHTETLTDLNHPSGVAAESSTSQVPAAAAAMEPTTVGPFLALAAAAWRVSTGSTSAVADVVVSDASLHGTIPSISELQRALGTLQGVFDAAPPVAAALCACDKALAVRGVFTS